MFFYRVAHIIRDRFGWLWRLFEWFNSVLFTLKYGGKLRNFSFNQIPEGFELIRIKDLPTNMLVDFFSRQPQEAFTFFHPHDFDEVSIKRLKKNNAFLAYILKDVETESIAGYCFNRGFFSGKGFRGRMVDIGYRGRGLGTAMNKILNEVGFGIGLRLYETVSRDNIASYRSALSASEVEIVKEMPNNELYLEIKR